MFSDKYPPAPHPRFKPKKLDSPNLREDPMINQLIEDLDSVKKDIDLNYIRLEYDSAMIKIMLEMISDLLGKVIELIKNEQFKVEDKPQKELDTGYGKF